MTSTGNPLTAEGPAGEDRADGEAGKGRCGVAGVQGRALALGETEVSGRASKEGKARWQLDTVDGVTLR